MDTKGTLNARQQALLDYIYIYMMAHNGRAPTYREILDEKVGRHTVAGAFTSKAVIRYNMQRLEDLEHITIIPDGSARNVTVPNGAFGIPYNMIHSIPLEKFSIRLISTSHLPNGKFGIQALATIRAWASDPLLIVYTYTTKMNMIMAHIGTNAWDDLMVLDSWGLAPHIHKPKTYEVFMEIILIIGQTGYKAAVITDSYFERQAAIAFDLGVFGTGVLHDAS